MLIDLQKRWALIQIPKTGCNSAASSLQALYKRDNSHPFCHKLRKHAIYGEFEDVLRECEVVLTTVRHPLDRIVSYYRYLRRWSPYRLGKRLHRILRCPMEEAVMKFGSWARYAQPRAPVVYEEGDEVNGHERFDQMLPQTNWISDENCRIYPNVQWVRLDDPQGLDQWFPNMPHLNKTPSRTPANITPGFREWVEHYFKIDYETFGY